MNENKKETNKLEGIISISAKGTGYVKIDGFKNDLEIEHQNLNTALHGDKVEIHMQGPSLNVVAKIITRAKKGFAGILQKENEIFFLKPDDPKMYTNILIPEKYLKDEQTNQIAPIGQKVFVEIISWQDSQKMPEGKIMKILGIAGNNDTEMRAIAMEKGFDSNLSEEAENEAKIIKQNGIQEINYKERKDFRKTLTFTIDPYDAKDFDDAISFKEIEKDMYEIGIHIADVSYYVKINSALDNEARERGTSVYLVDRTIPMLPEELSNDLCSLVPDQDRLTMSAVFTIDKNAKVKSEWYGPTVIHSQKRFTYEEAEKTIKNTNLPLHKELFILNNLAKKMTKERFENGAISLDQVEVKFVLDKNGTPLKVIKKERGDSNRLIEEFMLLANRKVAEFISKSVSIYRVHDKPNKEKTEDLAFFLKSLGYKITLKNSIIPSNEINKILENLEGKSEKDTIHKAVIRSMAKAVYSTKNIGHYGLAFKYYTHFTSPIRRYPDVLVHRILLNYLKGEKIGKEHLVEYEKIARIASEQEKRASDAERASIKYKQVEYMSSRTGEVFTGIISGVTEWGMYVEEIETKCEGLVRVRDLSDDFYIYNEKKLELLGQKKKKKYRLGDKVKIKVKNVDLERKTIDYLLA